MAFELIVTIKEHHRRRAKGSQCLEHGLLLLGCGAHVQRLAWYYYGDQTIYYRIDGLGVRIEPLHVVAKRLDAAVLDAVKGRE